MYLGICNNTGLVYEGMSSADIPSIPAPSVTQAKLILEEADWLDLPKGLTTDPIRWLFREESFDPVTRTRRGRLYVPQAGQAQPNQQRVGLHPYEDPMMRQSGAGGKVAKTLYTFSACRTLLDMRNQGQGLTLALGNASAASPWRIIQSEALATGSVLVTLKSLSVFAIVPAVDYRKIATEHHPAVAEAIDRVLSSAFRETPTSVVDHCRAALTVLLSRWLFQSGHETNTALALDLGALAQRVEARDMTCVAKAAQIVARLHARGKPNEQHARRLRSLEVGDDEFALESVGLALREFDWAVR